MQRTSKVVKGYVSACLIIFLISRGTLSNTQSKVTGQITCQWSIFTDRFAKEMFNGRYASQYFIVLIDFRNKSRDDFQVNSVTFSIPGVINNPPLGRYNPSLSELILDEAMLWDGRIIRAGKNIRGLVLFPKSAINLDKKPMKDPEIVIEKLDKLVIAGYRLNSSSKILEFISGEHFVQPPR